MSQIKTREIEGDVAIGRHVAAGGNANIQGDARVGHNLKVEGWLEARNIRGPMKGFFRSEQRLREVYPEPGEGWHALVGETLPARVFVAEAGKWVDTGKTAGVSVDVDYYNTSISELKDADTEATQRMDGLEEVLGDEVADRTMADKELENLYDGLLQDITSPQFIEMCPALKTVDGKADKNADDIYQLQQDIGSPQFIDICPALRTVDEKVDDNAEAIAENASAIAENALLRDNLLPLDALVDVPESSSLFSDRVGMSVDQVVWNTATQRLWGWNSATNHYYSSWPTWQKYGTQAETGAKGVIPAANRILYMASNPQTLYVKSNTAGLEQLHEATVNRTLANYNHLLAVDKKIGRLEENEADDERRITAVEEVAEMGRTKANAVQEATKGARFININTFTETDDAFPSLSDALDCVPEDYRWIYGTIVTFLYQGPWIVNGKQKQVRKWLWYRWTATAEDEDADWMHTDEWEQLPEMSHVTELGNRVTAAEGRLDTWGPLPFVFERHNRHFKDTDVAVYSRDENRFYRLGEVIAPEELGYNEEDPETGEVTASTRRRFICGNRLYRFTGIDFVDVAVERSTERRLVRKTPSINSHPGLVYINNDIIRLPQPGSNVGDVARIRLDGMYCRPSASLVPLSELKVEYNADCLSVERDGGSLVVTRIRDCRSYDDAARSRLYLTLGGGTGIGGDPYRHSGIGVRYDGSGRKVFYSCAQTVFPNAGWMPGEEGLRHVRENCVDVNASNISIRCQRGPHVQVQLWTKTKSRNKGVNKCRWRWRGGSDTFRKVWRDHCLVRVRLRHGGRNGVWSEWGYVHVMRVRNDSGGYGFKVRWSRQERK